MLRISSILMRCLVFVVLLPFVISSPLASAESAVRSYVSGIYFLSIDGVKCGFLKGVDGGIISAEVINEPAGPDYFTRKHIGQPRYEALTIQAGFSMTKEFYDWLVSSWNVQYQRKNCVLTSLDSNLQPKSARQFNRALITETTIPACDGSSKEPAYITLTLTPEYTQDVAASGVGGPYYKIDQNVWLPSNFQLQIDGLDCTKVNKIDSFTVKQGVVTDDIGDARDMLKEPGKLVFPNLRISMAEVTSQTWKAWFDDFVVAGNNDFSKEKSGTLTFLNPNRQMPLAQIKFHNLGIFRFDRDKMEANADQIKRAVAELYCERMEFVGPGPGLPGSVTSSSGSQEPATTDASAGSSTTSAPKATRSLLINAALDSSLTSVRKFGSDPALDFALKGLGYTITRQRVSNDSYAPDGQSKLMLIRYTMHNPSSEAMNVNPGTLKFMVTDSAGANHEAGDIGVGANNVRIGGSMSPDQTFDCLAVVILPGNVDAGALLVTYTNDGSPQKYQVAGQASIKEAYARDESAGAAARFTALAEVPIATGAYYPMAGRDYRLDSVAYAQRPKVESDAPENTRCLMVKFTVRNPSPEGVHFDNAAFTPVLIMSDGSNMPWYGYPLSDQQDRPITGDLTPGQELKMRVFFDVPASGPVTPATFRFSERESRVYLYDLKGLGRGTRAS